MIILVVHHLPCHHHGCSLTIMLIVSIYFYLIVFKPIPLLPQVTVENCEFGQTEETESCIR